MPDRNGPEGARTETERNGITGRRTSTSLGCLRGDPVGCSEHRVGAHSALSTSIDASGSEDQRVQLMAGSSGLGSARVDGLPRRDRRRSERHGPVKITR